MLKINKIYCKDAIEFMKKIDDKSIDIENKITHYINNKDTLRCWHWIRELIKLKFADKTGRDGK